MSGGKRIVLALLASMGGAGGLASYVSPAHAFRPNPCFHTWRRAAACPDKGRS
jgi:hypothetical protein